MSHDRSDSGSAERRQTPGSRMSGWIWVLVAGLLMLLWMNLDTRPKIRALAYTDFKQAVREGEVGQVTFRGQQLRGQYAKGESGQDEQAGRHFVTTLPPLDDPQLLSLLEQHEVKIQAEGTEELLEQHHPKLQTLAERLLAQETLAAEEINALSGDKGRGEAQGLGRRHFALSEH